jgi:hypothetical protein
MFKKKSTQKDSRPRPIIVCKTRRELHGELPPKRKPRPPAFVRWFISACRPMGHPHWGYWEFWGGESLVSRFEDAAIFSDPEECAKVAEEAARTTGVDISMHTVGPECGDVFVVLSDGGRFWSGSSWVEDWREARQWTQEPTVGPNMVRREDPSQDCQDECDRLRSEQGVCCNVAYMPEHDWVKDSDRRFSVCPACEDTRKETP